LPELTLLSATTPRQNQPKTIKDIGETNVSIINSAIRRLGNFIFGAPFLVIGLILAMTLFFALNIPGLKIYSDFSDLLPQNHPYIKLHNEIKDTFGGANVVIVGIEVKEGTIFTNETLALIQRLTQSVDNLPGVNHNLVSSLTHRTSRKVWLTETGALNSQAYYDPTKTNYSAAELESLKNDVLASPRIYGLLVSPDMKSALIKAQLTEGAIDYTAIFNKVQDMRKAKARPGVEIHAVGQPMLVGWVYSYINQIIQIFLYTVVVILVLLIAYFRRFYGVAIPLVAIAVSVTWGLGFVSLLGYNLDPLTLVVPFIVSARGLSHGVQVVERYYYELPKAKTGSEAARHTFEHLFRPGSLGVFSDAIGILVVAISSIPINHKLGIYAALWSISVIVTVLVLVPALLAVLPRPKVVEREVHTLGKVIGRYGALISKPVVARFALAVIAVLMLSGAFMASTVQIGESEPGSPLLYRNNDYNLSAKAVNSAFPGSEELYVVARTKDVGGLKRPEVLRAIDNLKTYMLADPELGGVKALPDLIKQVNRLIHNDDPRWLQIPHEPSYSGGLMFAYTASSPIPGAMKEFLNPEETETNIVFFYKDHRGDTIRRAVYRLEQWINNPANKVEGLSFHMAGGIIGVTAASNEASFSSNLEVIPLVFSLIFLCVALFYRSVAAGLLLVVSMSFATVLSYADMAINNIGINVNTVPIIAIGIGIGIDYAIYVIDRIREDMAKFRDVSKAVQHALSTTGLAVCFTAATLIAGVIMWVYFSDLRFQSDAAKLLIVMVLLNAVAALTLVPAWIIVMKPKFIKKYEEDEVIL
jgi:hypothetical protein